MIMSEIIATMMRKPSLLLGPTTVAAIPTLILAENLTGPLKSDRLRLLLKIISIRSAVAARHWPTSATSWLRKGLHGLLEDRLKQNLPAAGAATTTARFDSESQTTLR